MKKFIAVLLLVTAATGFAQLKNVSQDMIDYRQDSDIAWQTHGDRLCNSANARYVRATEAITPYALDFAVEMTVKPKVKRGRGTARTGVVLISADRRLSWELLLSDYGKNDRRVSVVLNSRIKGINNKTAQVKCIGRSYKWDYNRNYTLRLERKNGVITALVFLDGKEVSHQTAVDKSDIPLNFGLYAGPILTEFGNFKAKYDRVRKVTIPQRKPVRPKYVPYANVSKEFKAKATGFFYTKQDKDGRWWLVDPAGNGFFACGADGVTWFGRSCEKLGYSEYHRSVRAKYENEKEWMLNTKKRFNSWGFNYAGTCGGIFRDQIPFAVNLMIGSNFASMGDAYNICPYLGKVGTALPNPFHPRFGEFAKKRIIQSVGHHIGNPYFLGYYCDNELRWGGAQKQAADGTGLFDAVMAKPADHTAKIALVKQLEQKYSGDISKFNKIWKSDFKKFADILNVKELNSSAPEAFDDKIDFLKLTADTYFRVLNDNLRAAAPQHLFLGCRYAGVGAHEIIWKANAKYCDIVSFNIYPTYDKAWNNMFGPAVSMDKVFDRIYKMCNRPMMVTEWAFLGLDSALPCTHGAGQRFFTQKERAHAAGMFYRIMLRHKAMVGCSWYEFSDDPALGVRARHPENSNYGLVNKFDQPYTELVNTFAEINKDIDKVRKSSSEALPEGKIGNLYKQFDERTPGKKQVKVKLTKSGFDVTNGTIRLRTTNSGRTEVFHKRLKTGYVNYIVNTENKARTWSISRNYRDIKITQLRNGVEILFTGDSKSINGKQSATVRLFVPSQGSYVMADLVSIKNEGNENLILKGFYFVLHSSLENLPPDPNLGRAKESSWNVGAWVDKQANFLAAANSLGRFDILFFTHPKEGDKADCARTFNETIKPGAVFKPDSPAYIFFYTGTGAHETRGNKLINTDIR
ncbi:MAG: hypothetical protein IJW08_04670 [Lentisphaeria bacterium]|nr:hypothetical protein [Lentisphaeria bacterium]